jgi:hypothetical protein
MTLSDQFLHRQVKGKDVYIVDDHHRALAAWACVRRVLEQAPNLISIDHHTDTHEAFLGYAWMEKYEGRVGDEVAFRDQLIKKIDWRNNQSLLDAIRKLKHDEHINAATLSGILSHAFCIQLSDSGGSRSVEQIAYDADRQARWPNPPALPPPIRPLTYNASPDHVYVIPYDCFVGCVAQLHYGDCVTRLADEIIETRYLNVQLDRGSEISSCLGLINLEAAPYILDIDLDVFHTCKAISPDDPAILYRLIKNAVAISIATEAQCVEELWLDKDNRIGSSDLLAALLDHVAKAL